MQEKDWNTLLRKLWQLEKRLEEGELLNEKTLAMLEEYRQKSKDNGYALISFTGKKYTKDLPVSVVRNSSPDVPVRSLVIKETIWPVLTKDDRVLKKAVVVLGPADQEEIEDAGEDSVPSLKVDLNKTRSEQQSPPPAPGKPVAAPVLVTKKMRKVYPMHYWMLLWSSVILSAGVLAGILLLYMRVADVQFPAVFSRAPESTEVQEVSDISSEETLREETSAESETEKAAEKEDELPAAEEKEKEKEDSADEVLDAAWMEYTVQEGDSLW